MQRRKKKKIFFSSALLFINFLSSARSYFSRNEELAIQSSPKSKNEKRTQTCLDFTRLIFMLLHAFSLNLTLNDKWWGFIHFKGQCQ